jgi:hypothetical protein
MKYLDKLEEGAAKRAGLSKKQHRNQMTAVSNVTAAERKASGSEPSDAFIRGVKTGATKEILSQAARKKKQALDAKKLKAEKPEREVSHTSYQQIGDILAEAMFGKTRTKVADKLDKFSSKQYKKGESDEASGKEWRAAVRGRVSHAAGKLAQKVRPKDKG